MSIVRANYKPGDRVPCSGIYDVTHGRDHAEKHALTCVFDGIFPACNQCDSASFTLRIGAAYAETHPSFTKIAMYVKRS